MGSISEDASTRTLPRIVDTEPSFGAAARSLGPPLAVTVAGGEFRGFGEAGVDIEGILVGHSG